MYNPHSVDGCGRQNETEKSEDVQPISPGSRVECDNNESLFFINFKAVYLLFIIYLFIKCRTDKKLWNKIVNEVKTKENKLWRSVNIKLVQKHTSKGVILNSCSSLFWQFWQEVICEGVHFS